MHVIATAKPTLAAELSGLVVLVPRPTWLADVKTIYVTNSTGQIVSTETRVGPETITILSNVNLDNHTVFIS
jgi:hypothetical protein